MDVNPSFYITDPNFLIKRENIYQANPTELDQSEEAAVQQQFTLMVVAGLTANFSDLIIGINQIVPHTIGNFFSEKEILSNEQRQAEVNGFKMSYLNHEKIIEKLQVTTFTKAILDGVLVYPDKNSKKQEKCVIWLNGFQEVYETKLSRAVQYANKVGVTVLLFNYQGTGDSQGNIESLDDLVKNTLSIIDFVQTVKKVDPKSLVLHGFSLGSGVAAKVATIKNEILFITDRGGQKFSSLVKDAVQKKLTPKYGEYSAKRFAKFAAFELKKNGFEFDTKKLYLTSNKHDKNSLESRTFIIYHGNDNVIQASKSLYTALSSQIPPRRVINLQDYEPTISLEFITEVFAEAADKYGTPNYEKVRDGLRDQNQYPLSEYRNYLSLILSREIQRRRDQFNKQSLLGSNEDIAKELLDIDNMRERLHRESHSLSFLIFDEVVDQLRDFIHGEKDRKKIVKIVV